MKKIGIIIKGGIPETTKTIKDLLQLLIGKGFEVFVELEMASTLRIKGYTQEELPSLVDMMMVFGGDGTLLSAARLVGDKGSPILGVNLGGLGFVTEIALNEVQDSIDRIISKEYSLEERIMLFADVHREGMQAFTAIALNDAVIHKSALARMIEFDTHINQRYVTSLRGDGLIISTPTGSTAHSLSAGGPILYPTLESFVMTPICPHTLTQRPIVLPDRFTLEITLKKGEDVYLTLDGQVGFSLKEGDVIKVKRADHKTRFIRFPDKDYFQILRTKLRWGEW